MSNYLSSFPGRILGAVLALGFLFLAGCPDDRPERVPVSGRVLVDGKPLEAGFVRVIPANDRAATGAVGEDGRFSLMTYEKDDGCVPGKHRVTIVAKQILGPTATRWFVPKKYACFVASGLMIDVTGPRNDVEIHLTWKGSGHEKPFIERVEEKREQEPTDQ